MKRIIKLTFVFFLIILTSFKPDKPNSAFQEKLLKAKMTFVMPQGFQETEVISNKQMNYDYAMKNIDRNFEVRLAIRPLDELLKLYNEKESNKKSGENYISPNKFYQALFITTLMNISGGYKPNGGPFPKEAVKSEFNADWGASSMLEVGKEFGQGYKYCVMVAIHKDYVADAYYFYLANDKETIQELMPSIFHCLKFN